MKRILCLMVTILIVLTFASCGKGYSAEDSMNSFDGGMESEKYPGGAYDSDNKVEDTATEKVEENRKIIKTVDETVQTDAYDDFIVSLKETVNQCSGYIENASYSGSSYYDKYSSRYAYFVIRIPADKLDTFTAGVDSMAVVTSYNEGIRDVTMTYIDIDSRITVLEAEEKVLLDILSKADTVNSMLSVRSQLNSVQSDLASLRAQKKALDDKISYSTVNLRVNEVRVVTVTDTPTFFEEVKAEFTENLYDIGQGFRDFGVWFLGNILYLLMFAAFCVAAFFVLVKVRKNLARREENGGSMPKDKDGEEK
ncbi:MAG: DUF4349 domain-containing protein [Clostridia bacterium]|nr:DUF4349 domain-containing protein [Clostridia bacterium]